MIVKFITRYYDGQEVYIRDTQKSKLDTTEFNAVLVDESFKNMNYDFYVDLASRSKSDKNRQYNLMKELYTIQNQYKEDKKIINIHPSLLPKFGGKGMYGIRVHEAVLAAGEELSGCTVHYVSAEVDGGTIIAQSSVPVMPVDTPEQLAQRVQQAEKNLLPQVIGDLING